MIVLIYRDIPTRIFEITILISVNCRRSTCSFESGLRGHDSTRGVQPVPAPHPDSKVQYGSPTYPIYNMISMRVLLRNLIKACKETTCTEFQGDHPALGAAFIEIRSQFMMRSNAAESEVPQLVEAGKEAAAFLNEAVVQAKLTDSGAYSMHPLRLHDCCGSIDRHTHIIMNYPMHFCLCRGVKFA